MVIIGNGTRVMLPAIAAALMFGSAAVRPASANEFTDACVAGGGGLFEAKDCACMDGKISAAGDRTDLTAYFKINADVAKGNAPPSGSDATLSKGTELLNKYLGQCMK